MIRVLPDAPVLEWEVKLHGVPPRYIKTTRQGYEIVANWQFEDFVNDGTFYTDSNGLEMQKRVLNHREGYEFKSDNFAPSNYYPVNFAAAIRDSRTNKQVTVMNDRAQGGASLANGSIELMHNRRTFYSDDLGLGDGTEEANYFSQASQVNVRYYLQIFDTSVQQSAARTIQRMIDEPVFYFSAAMTSDSIDSSKRKRPVLQTPDFDGELKFHLFPESATTVLLRVENIADIFDGTPSETPMFDLNEFARNLYIQSNPDLDDFEVEITERNLADSQDYAQLAEERFEWPVVGEQGRVRY